MIMPLRRFGLEGFQIGVLSETWRFRFPVAIFVDSSLCAYPRRVINVMCGFDSSDSDTWEFPRAPSDVSTYRSYRCHCHGKFEITSGKEE